MISFFLWSMIKVQTALPKGVNDDKTICFKKRDLTCTLRTKDGATRFSKSSMGVYEFRIFTIYRNGKQADSKHSMKQILCISLGCKDTQKLSVHYKQAIALYRHVFTCTDESSEHLCLISAASSSVVLLTWRSQATWDNGPSVSMALLPCRSFSRSHSSR